MENANNLQLGEYQTSLASMDYKFFKKRSSGCTILQSIYYIQSNFTTINNKAYKFNRKIKLKVYDQVHKVYKNIFSKYLILWKYIFVYFVYQRPNWLEGFVIKNLQIQDLGYMWQKTVKVRNLMVLFMKKKFKVNISQSQGCKSNEEKIY